MVDIRVTTTVTFNIPGATIPLADLCALLSQAVEDTAGAPATVRISEHAGDRPGESSYATFTITTGARGV